MESEKKLSRGKQTDFTNSTSSSKQSKANGEPLAKRPKLLTGDSDSESTSWDAEEPVFKINEEFAKRFEHNKKREELQRLDEKYGAFTSRKRKTDDSDNDEGNRSDSDESPSSQDDDDEGVLVTEQLDAEISATLQALRAKDPRVYDKTTAFYSDFNEVEQDGAAPSKNERPMFLRDYHRKTLLEGHVGDEDDEDGARRTYAQEQEDLKKTVVKEMHAAFGAEADSDENDEFWFGKKRTITESRGTVANGRAKKITEVDIAVADKDPELFLTNFMSARAWVSTDSSQFKPFESDDDDEDERAEIFEQAYNLRFEDPEGSNEKLMTHSREAATKYSFRREGLSGRKKAREAQRQKKEEEKRQREEEMARLRKLKIDEMEEKVRKIKEAAGLRGKAIRDEDWANFLADGWDGDNWEQEMNKRFGDAYYAEVDYIEDEDGEGHRKKAKKPKWDDDIDIKDLVPDFEDEEVVAKTAFLSDEDNNEDGPVNSEMDMSESDCRLKKGKIKKDRLQERLDKKKEARKERKRIEQLVDEKLDLDFALPSASSSKIPTRFRYRETSPETFGLTPKDILLASDSQLNQFVGLKKMAAFRDPGKKRTDKKKLGKKARLRQWRKETFGNEDGPVIEQVEQGVGPSGTQPSHAVFGDAVNAQEGQKKRRRSGKGKGKGKGRAIET